MKISISTKYFVVFLFLISVIGTKAMQPEPNKINIEAASASSWETVEEGGGGDFPPEFAIDGNIKTSFRVEGHGQWLMLDMGKETDIEYINIIFGSKSHQNYTFDIDVSTDNNSWIRVLNQQKSEGIPDKTERYDLNKLTRYIKLSGYGNTSSVFPNWLVIYEIEAFGKE